MPDQSVAAHPCGRWCSTRSSPHWLPLPPHCRTGKPQVFFVLGFTALLRWDDLQRLLPQDVSICGTHMSLHLRQDKNDQLRQGDVVTVSRLEQQATTPCPVSVIEGFLERARHVPAQPLFGMVAAVTHQS